MYSHHHCYHWWSQGKDLTLQTNPLLFLRHSLSLMFSLWLDIITPSSCSGKQNSDLYLCIGMVAQSKHSRCVVVHVHVHEHV